MKKNKPFGELFYCSLKKIFLIMRITIIFLVLGVFHAHATDAYSQKTRISLNLSNTELVDVLDKIEVKSEFYFLYNEKLLNTRRKVNIKADNELLTSILDELFAGTEVKYTFIDSKIILAPEYLTEQADIDIIPQQQTLTGTVTDASTNELMPGVNVLLKGTSVGALTDVNGRYSIPVTDLNGTLVFSFIGYNTQEIALAGRSIIDAILIPSIESLEEVVVVGYGIQKKVSLTGSVGVIGSSDMTKQAIGDAISRVQGQIAGVTVTLDNRPGSTSTIRIRGYGSLGNNNPLFVIDGIPRTEMDNINPNDIESMSILKDASSTAIYGSRAANGVVLITTKRGVEGKAKLNFSFRRGYQFNTNKPDLMNSEEIGLLLWQKFKNMGLNEGDVGWGDAQYGYGATPRIPDYILPAGKMIGEVDESTYTHPSIIPFNAITKANKGDNLWDLLWWQGAPVTEYNLNMSGGTAGSVYSITVGYADQKSLYNFNGDDITAPTKDGFKRYTLRANNDLRFTNWLKISPDINVNYLEFLGSTGTGTGSGILTLHPILPVYDIMGNFAGSKVPSSGNGRNPVAILDRARNNISKSLIAQGSITGEFQIMKDLIFKSLIGANLGSRYNESFSLLDPEFNQTSNTTSMDASNNNEFQYNWVNTLNYLININSIHNFNVLLGTELLENSKNNLGASRSTYAFETLDYLIISSGEKDIRNSGSRDRNRLFSYFGRINYDYKGKYLAEASVRRDASSRFVGDYRWGTFPAFSAGWRISKETFMSNLSLINDLKIRVSWGQNGNDNVGNYNAYSTYSARVDRSYYNLTGASRSSANAGFSINRIGNPNAKWETGISKNIGIDISMFNSKLTGNFDLFERRTIDMLYDDTRPSVWGMVNLPQINIGEMENRGFDLSLTYNGGKVGSNLNYKVSATFSHFKNEVVKLNNNPDEIYYGTQTDFGYYTATHAGHPIESFYGYIFEGYFNSWEDVANWPKFNPNAQGIDIYSQPGVMKYKDVSGPDGVPDGKITPLDRTWLGDGFPDLSYGININVNYKNWDLFLLLQGIQGRDIVRNYDRYLTFIRMDGNYLRKRLYESWTPERYAAGETITVPITLSTDSNMQAPSTWFISDGSYARLKELQLGYTLPAVALSKLNISSLRIFGQVSNLFTITAYEGLNPEVNDLGIDNNVYPTPRVFSFGINVVL